MNCNCGTSPDSADIVFYVQKRLAQFGPKIAFNRGVLYDEKQVLDTAMPYIKRQLGMDRIDVIPSTEADPEAPGYAAPIVETAEPGKPGIVFYNTSA